MNRGAFLLAYDEKNPDSELGGSTADERKRRLDEICSAAMRQDAGARAEFLRQACGDDAALRREAESVLGYETQLTGFLETPAAPSLLGRTLGPYEVESLLGAGGMGEVYAARDTRLGRLVALKILKADADSELKHRLLIEAKAASALNDPRIVVLHDIGSAEGIDFLVMECVRGETLERVIARGKLEIATALEYARAIAGALATAHAAGIIHRDLKPGNIMIGEQGAVKVLDFGLAKFRATEAAQGAAAGGANSLMSSGAVIAGTAAYMSPEQAQGKPVDARSDIFSFGVVLYEMLTGQRPFQGSDRMTTLEAVVNCEPRAVRELNARVPTELERLIGRCLCKSPAERYPEMYEVRAALDRLIASKPAARRSWIRMAAAAVLILGCLAIYQWMPRGTRSKVTTELAVRQLTANPPGDRVVAAGISPDGKYVAYQDQTGYFVRTVASGETQTIPLPPRLLNRGSWGSLRWTPDGGKLLVQVPIPGSADLWGVTMPDMATPRLLYHDAADPAISPDGRWIAFRNGQVATAGEELWVGGIDGGPPRLLASAKERYGVFYPAWSPDGRRIAYWRTDGDLPLSVGIEVRPASGGPAKTLVPASRLPKTAWLPAGGMTWSYDWRLIFSLIDDTPSAGSQGDGAIWALAVDPDKCEARRKPERLVQWAGFLPGNLSLSANGKRLALLKFHPEDAVYVGELDGDGNSMKAPHRITLDTRGGQVHAWTPDSRALIYDSNRNGTFEIFRHGIDASVPEKVIESAGQAWNPALSPGGEWFLYWEQLPPIKSGMNPPAGRLMRRRVSGGPAEFVLEVPADNLLDFQCPLTSGSCILSRREGTEMAFYAVDPARGKGRHMAKIEMKTNLGDVAGADWSVSPDGSQLAVVDSQPSIAVFNSSEGAWKKIVLARDWGILSAITWTADGGGFYAVSSISGSFELLHVPTSGRVRRIYHQPSGSLLYPRPSPDGRYLAFVAQTLDSNVWMMENF